MVAFFRLRFKNFGHQSVICRKEIRTPEAAFVSFQIGNENGDFGFSK